MGKWIKDKGKRTKEVLIIYPPYLFIRFSALQPEAYSLSPVPVFLAFSFYIR